MLFKKFNVFLFLLFALISLFEFPIFASNEGVTVSFLIDRSGSMDDNDPKDLRLDAAISFVNKMNFNKDLAGVIEFDDGTRVLSEITNDKDQIISAVKKVGSNGGTDISRGLRKSIDQLKEESTQNKRYIILLTDGIDDREPKYDYKDLTKEARDNNIVIYCVGLSGNVNASLLRDLAKQTGGNYFQAKSAEDLGNLYDNIYSAINISISKEAEYALLSNVSYKNLTNKDAQNRKKCSTLIDSCHVTNDQIDYLIMGNTVNLHSPETYTQLYQRYLGDWVVDAVFKDTDKEKNSGFYAVALYNEKNGQYVMSYRGSEDILNKVHRETDWQSNFTYYFQDKASRQQKKAVELTSDYIGNHKNIILVGHSLGGGLAIMMSNITGAKAYAFNGSPTLDASYYSMPEYMAAHYTEPGDVNYTDYINSSDSLIGMHEYEYENALLHKSLANGSSDRLGFLENHYIESYLSLLPKDYMSGDYEYQFVSENSNKLANKTIKKYTGVEGGILGLGSSIKDTISGYGVKEFEKNDDQQDLKEISYNDVLYGGKGDDTLNGLKGRDTLIGGQGNDTLNGSEGDDEYIYYEGDGLDTVNDSYGNNKISIYYSSSPNVTVSVENKYLIVKANGNDIIKINRKMYTKDGSGFDIGLYPNFNAQNSFAKTKMNISLPGNAWNSINKKAETYSNSCPINVEIYNPSNQLVLTMEDGHPQTYNTDFGEFIVFENQNGEYSKYFTFFEDGYTYKIIGNDQGSMTLLASVEDDSGKIQNYAAVDVPVSRGDQYNGSVTNNAPVVEGAQNVQFKQTYNKDAESVDIAENEISLGTGQSTKINYSISPADAGYEFISGDPSIVQVDSNGNLTGISDGEVSVIIKTDNGLTDSVNIIVGIGDIENNESLDPVSYSAHVQDIGWQNQVDAGQVAGTTGQNKQLEAIQFISNEYGLNLKYRAHVSEIGWQDYVEDEEVAGTEGQGLPIEALQIELTGDNAQNYDLYYRAHAQDYGWLDWAKAGEPAGTEGMAKHLEAVQIVVLDKGTEAPGATNRAFISKDNLGNVMYKTHVENIGWQNYMADGDIAGTSGQALRLEGIQIKLADNIDGGVRYKTHVEDYGWQDWVNNDQMAGTTGEAKRLEAIQIELTGAAANAYDVYYRVHAQDVGWMNWAKNGEQAGTAGYARRLEAIQIRLVSKGQGAPELNPPNNSDQAFLDKNNETPVVSISPVYQDQLNKIKTDSSYHSHGDPGYALYDLDGDGVNELLVGSLSDPGYFYNLFTDDNGHIIDIAGSPIEQMWVGIADNNDLLMISEEPLPVSARFTFDGQAGHFKEQYTKLGNSYYYSNSLDDPFQRSISESEYNNYTKSKTFNLTPIM